MRSKTLGISKLPPIVILSNDNLSEESANGDAFIWKDINKFEDIYIIKGSALNPSDLQRARISKAKTIILSKVSVEENMNERSHNLSGADAIFMYKTIRSTNKNVAIITELASLAAVNFLSKNKNEHSDNTTSKQFCAGEIFFTNLLDTIMC